VVNEYIGGYADWLRQRQPTETVSVSAAKAPTARRLKPVTSGGKLGYLQQRELEQLPEQIEQLEAQLAELHSHMTTPGFYRLPGETINAEKQRLANLETALQDAYRRWEDLECQKPV
jgi:ATP-binding cassette subfamily F protein uup